MTEIDVMRPKAGRARRAATPEGPAAKFDAQVRQHYGVPWNVGMKIIAVLRGQHRAAFLHKVDMALACPPEADGFGSVPVSAELVAGHEHTLAQLGHMRLESAGRIIAALRWHPLALIGALNDLLPVTADWQTEIIGQGQRADLTGKDQRNLQRSGMGRDTTTARKPRHPLPTLPRGLRRPHGADGWPVDFDKAPEFGRHPKAPGGIVAYLKREWRKIIAAGLIDMPTLWENFPKAATAINTYTKPHPETDEKRTLPKKLTIPNVSQVIDQKLERVLAGDEVVDRETHHRLSVVARWRAKNWPRAIP